MTNPHTKERIEVDLDVGGRATITVPAELMATLREVLSKSRFIYSGGNSLFLTFEVINGLDHADDV